MSKDSLAKSELFADWLTILFSFQDHVRVLWVSSGGHEKISLVEALHDGHSDDSVHCHLRALFSVALSGLRLSAWLHVAHWLPCCSFLVPLLPVLPDCLQQGQVFSKENFLSARLGKGHLHKKGGRKEEHQWALCIKWQCSSPP